MTIIALEGAQSINAQDVMAQQNELLYAAATRSEQRDDRPAALLVIRVLAIALWGATSVPPKPGSVLVATPSSDSQDAEDLPTDDGSAPSE
jgi:hypothetical protein